jgi:hypothetical protein
MTVNRKQFPSEHLVTTWSLLILTTHRVVLQEDATVLAHKITGTRISRSDDLALLVIAVIVAVVGYVADQNIRGVQHLLVLAVVIAAIFVGLYFLRRQTIVEIFCDDGRILKCTITGAAELEHARRFVDAVERIACTTSGAREGGAFPESPSSEMLKLETRPPSNL